MSQASETCLLVYWEAADWEQVQRLVQAGHLPMLAGLLREGVAGPLHSPPPLAPWPLATSLLTGRIAADHGIVHCQQALAGSDHPEPVTPANLEAAPLWRILATAQRPAAFINWPLSYPAPAESGLVVSEHFFKSRMDEGSMLDPAPGSVAPEQQLAPLLRHRRHASQLSAQQTDAFWPASAGAEEKHKQARALLAVQLAELESVAATACACLAGRELRLLAVRFSGLSALAAGLNPLDPEHREAGTQFHRALDRALGLLLASTGPAGTVLLCSGHSLLPPLQVGKDHRLTERDLYRPDGFLVAAGQRVQTSNPWLGVSLLDIVPSLLALYGLPQGRDMPGRVLAEILKLPNLPAVVHTWDSCLKPEPEPTDLRVHRELLAESWQLPAASLEELDIGGKLARAASLAALGASDQALAILQCPEPPDDPEYLRTLAHLELDRGDADENRIKRLVRRLMRLGGERFDENLLLARLESQNGRHQVALDCLFEVLGLYPDHPALHLFIGQEYQRLGRLEQALTAFDNALARRPGQHAAQLGRAEVLLALDRPDEAMSAALDAIASRFKAWRGHRLLGQALEALGEDASAAQAYQVGLDCTPPGLDCIHDLLRLYGPERLNRVEQYQAMQARLARQLVSRSLGLV
ncbi:MAG: tetratricopeptide repeat protein [Wenzhouxiangella sp.]|nr:tetratricopeptide repeat protein [Wenzhouxiangella sp.]